MSIPDQIRSLEQLAAIDAELRTLGEEIEKERSTLSTLRDNLKRLDDALAVERETLNRLDKTRNEFVNEVRSMSQQIDQSRDKLGRSRTERESNAAQREIEELRKLLKDREEELGKVTAESDAVRQRVEATEAEAKGVQDQLGSSEGEISSRLKAVEEVHRAKSVEREGAVKALPPQLFRRYDMVRQKRGSGIAQTTDGTCTACNMSLPPQLFHRLRREPLIEQCPSCNRIIYFAALVKSEGAIAQ